MNMFNGFSIFFFIYIKIWNDLSFYNDYHFWIYTYLLLYLLHYVTLIILYTFDSIDMKISSFDSSNSESKILNFIMLFINIPCHLVFLSACGHRAFTVCSSWAYRSQCCAFRSVIIHKAFTVHSQCVHDALSNVSAFVHCLDFIHLYCLLELRSGKIIKTKISMCSLNNNRKFI